MRAEPEGAVGAAVVVAVVPLQPATVMLTAATAASRVTRDRKAGVYMSRVLHVCARELISRRNQAIDQFRQTPSRAA
jgi:hypothetical protein